MNTDLMAYTQGAPVPRYDRAVARSATGIRKPVREGGFAIDGITAVGVHTMERVVDLDDERRRLAGKDPLLNVLLSDVEQQAIRDMARVQASVGRRLSGWL